MVLSAVEFLREFQLYDCALACGDLQIVVNGSFGSGLLRIQAMAMALDEEIVDRILLIEAAIGHSEQPAQVAFILGEQELRRTCRIEPALAVLRVIDAHHGKAVYVGNAFKSRLSMRGLAVVAPRPGISEPNRWKQVQSGGIGSTIPGN